MSALRLGAPRNEARGAESGGNIDNRFGGGGTDGVSKQRRMIAGLFFRFALKIVLASGSSCHLRFDVLLGHERLFAHEKQIEAAPGFARFAQGEVERAAGSANRTKDRFARGVRGGAWRFGYHSGEGIAVNR